MTVAGDIIADALALVTSSSPTAAIPGGEASHALRTLNRMMKAWGEEGLMQPYRTLEELPLSPGTASYTIGATGVWQTARPEIVTGAFVRHGGQDYGLTVFQGSQPYNEIRNKAQTGVPEFLYYDPQHPNGRIYVWPTGNGGDRLFLESRKPFNQFSSLSATIDLPDVYEEHLMYQLARRLAPQYGFSLTPDHYALMTEARDRVERMRAQPVMTDWSRIRFPTRSHHMIGMGGAAAGGVGGLLTEDGSYLLTEDGGNLLIE